MLFENGLCYHSVIGIGVDVASGKLTARSVVAPLPAAARGSMVVGSLAALVASVQAVDVLMAALVDILAVAIALVDVVALVEVVPQVDTVEVVDTVLVDTVLVDTVQVDPVLVDTVQVDTVLVEAVLVDAVLVDTVLVDTVQVDTVLVDAVLVDTVQVDTVSVEAVLVDASPLRTDALVIVLVAHVEEHTVGFGTGMGLVADLPYMTEGRTLGLDVPVAVVWSTCQLLLVHSTGDWFLGKYMRLPAPGLTSDDRTGHSEMPLP
jgi:hypothetical protein